MCFEYEWEYQQRRAEEARRELQRQEEDRKKKPVAPAEVPQPVTKEPIPV
jgi:hypothetical protein